MDSGGQEITGQRGIRKDCNEQEGLSNVWYTALHVSGARVEDFSGKGGCVKGGRRRWRGVGIT